MEEAHLVASGLSPADWDRESGGGETGPRRPGVLPPSPGIDAAKSDGD